MAKNVIKLELTQEALKLQAKRAKRKPNRRMSAEAKLAKAKRKARKPRKRKSNALAEASKTALESMAQFLKPRLFFTD